MFFEDRSHAATFSRPDNGFRLVIGLLHLLNRVNTIASYGAVAQLGERRVRNAKVGSSILLRSTTPQWRTGKVFLVRIHSSCIHTLIATSDRMFAILLLAAGHGRRYQEAGGQGCKLLADVSASLTVIRRSCETLLAPGWPIHVVTGPFDRELRQALQGFDVNFVTNVDGGNGLGSSIARGVAASPDADGWLVALGDMPFIRSGTILRIAEALKAGAPIVFPVHHGKRGHPVGFSRRFRQDLLELEGDTGARKLLGSHASDCVAVEVDDDGVLRDIDLPSDLRPASPASNL